MLYALDPDRSGGVIWEVRVGRIIRNRGPSFGGVEHGIAADHQRAYVPIADIDVLENTAYGALVAVDLASGNIVWRFDTAVEVDGINGLSGRGGSISRGGTALVNGMFFQSSGYGQGMGMPGNVLCAFEYPVD